MTTINLTSGVVTVLQDLRKQSKEPQEKLNMLNQNFQNIIIAICLQNELRFEEYDITLSEDLTVINAKPKEPIVTETPKSTKVKKM